MSEETRTELEMQEELVTRFKERGLTEDLENAIESDIAVGVEKGVNIPYKIWLEPQNGLSNSRLQVRHFEQDVVFYVESDISEEDHLSFYQTRDTNLQVPLCIVEVKSGGMGTDTVLSYSSKAEKIKSVFPFLSYIVVTGNERRRKWNLHGQEFDSIYSLGGQDPSEWKLDRIEEALRSQFEQVANNVDIFESGGRL